MVAATPHYLLFSEAEWVQRPGIQGGRWRFVLEPVQMTEDPEDEETIEAAETEAGIARERLELLAVVRGLEALNQPSHVTLVTPSRYVHRGIRFGLPQWRMDGWQWERFGRMVPVANSDLWQRVDRALQIHRVKCRRWQAEPSHGTQPVAAKPQAAPAPASATADNVAPAPSARPARVSQTAACHRSPQETTRWRRAQVLLRAVRQNWASMAGTG